jgi:hypothetical protein
MQTHTGTWGHVGLPVPATAAMQEAEEAHLMAMMHCRYGRIASPARASLLGFLPHTDEVIFNPNTLQDLANIFEINIEKAFA